LSCLVVVVTTELALQVLRRALLLGIVLVVLAVLDMVLVWAGMRWITDNAYLLVVETLSVLLGLVLGLLFVDVVKALGLDELVDLSTGKRSNKLLGELVVDGLALLALSLLESMHGSERGTTSEDLVGELALVVVVVSLVVGVGRFTW